MKNPLSDLYEQVLLKEAEKFQLQNPSQDEVGNLNSKQDLFGEKPKAVEGPDKATLAQGPSYKETTGAANHLAKGSNGTSFKGAAPAKHAKGEKPTEMKNTDVDPSNKSDEDEDKDKKKKEKHEESFTMSAFETLFKKTLNEEMDEASPMEAPASETSEPINNVDTEEESAESEEELEEEEGDLISDLHDLKDKLDSILSKLEDIQEEEEGLESSEDSYTEEEFNDEFSDEEGEEEEEEPFKESLDKPKALAPAKGKTLMNKKNKVGKLSAKGGKAHGGSIKTQPKPTALGDKKTTLQKGHTVKSNISKGEFFK
jgi:hypothetical protein